MSPGRSTETADGGRTPTEPVLSRRTLLRTSAVGAGAVVLSSAPGAATRAAGRSRRRTRVYVLVVDGCRPGEVSAPLTPRLAGLRRGGLHLPQARSLPIMETIPNHVMMMSGMRPDRTGVPANSVYDRRREVIRELDRPSDLRAPTVLERLDRRGLTTGTVLSKEYLVGIFGERATHRWEPEFYLPVSDHAPDLATTNALIDMVDAHDPDLVFTNLGDIDRAGHADYTGQSVKVARRTALADTDQLVGRFVDHLKDTGRWQDSVLVVLADHSMDWSDPDALISLQPVLDSDPFLAGRVTIAQNGGADLLYWTGPDRQRDEAVQRMRRLVPRTEGVLSVHAPQALRLTARAGDLVAYCQAGWRFSDPQPVSNPIPGNHGHPTTEPIPFFVAGGHPAVPRGRTSSAPTRTVDVAPTVGALLGLPAPRGGYDGTNVL